MEVKESLPAPAKPKKEKKTPAPVVEKEDEELEEEEPEVVKQEIEESKPKKEAKAKKKKGTTYSRANDQHKAMLGDLLRVHAPDWKSSEKNKAKARDLSQSLEGKDFLDAEGEILDSFIEIIIDAWK